MRILHVIPAVAARYGGPSTAIWPMVRALREVEGFDVEIATTDADGPNGRLTVDQLPTDAGVVHLFRRHKGENLKYSRDLNIWLQLHTGDYDLVHVHSNWNYPVVAACRAARRARVPYIMRPCGMLSQYTWNKSRWKKRAWWWLCERKNIRSAAGFHVTSEAERQEVLRLGVDAPVEVIPLGISNDAWETPVEPDWLRTQYPQAGDRPIVLFLSRLHPKKGIVDLLLPAMSKLQSEAFLAIVGGEDDHAPGYRLQVEREITRLHLRDRVVLLGPVPPHRRWAAFDGCDLFVLPSHSENFGIVVAEAMARGKPVVVTTGVQFADHVTESEGGAVSQPDIDELSNHIDDWISHESRRIHAGNAGREYIRWNFTWEHVAKRLTKMYRLVTLGADRHIRFRFMCP